jgi:hypothetical protein
MHFMRQMKNVEFGVDISAKYDSNGPDDNGLNGQTD